MHFQRLIFSTAWSLTSPLCAITLCLLEAVLNQLLHRVPSTRTVPREPRMCEANADCTSAASVLPLRTVWSAHLNGPPSSLLFHHLERGEEGKKGVNSNAIGSPGFRALLGEWVTSRKRHKFWSGKIPSLQCRWACFLSEWSCQCYWQGSANTAGAWSIGGGQCTVLACWCLLTVTGNYSTFFQSYLMAASRRRDGSCIQCDQNMRKMGIWRISEPGSLLFLLVCRLLNNN